MPGAAPPVQHKIGYYQVAQNIGFIPILILKHFITTVEQVTIKEMSKIELKFSDFILLNSSVALYSFGFEIKQH